MPRPYKLEPVKRRGRWWLNIPDSLSETGKRQQLCFPTKEQASAEAARRRDHSTKYGNQRILGLGEIADAAAAIAALEGTGVSLTEAAIFYAEHQIKSNSSMTVFDLYDRFIVSRATNGASSRYLADLRQQRDKLPEDYAEGKIYTLTRSQAIALLDEMGPTPYTWNSALRVLRAALSYAVEEEWITDNPARRIRAKKISQKAPGIATPAQVRAAFDAALPEAVPALALMIFAGIRPDETKRLDWSNIEMDSRNIRVPAKASKTETARNIHIEDCLLRWLIPHRQKSGRVIPNNWHRQIQVIRKAAGVAHIQDVWRHTYGSYWLSAFEDPEKLKLHMGHTHLQTYLKHYHRAVKKNVALKFWKIEPR